MRPARASPPPAASSERGAHCGAAAAAGPQPSSASHLLPRSHTTVAYHPLSPQGRLPNTARSRRQPSQGQVEARTVCLRSCAGLRERTRRRPATAPMPPARGPPTWNPPAPPVPGASLRSSATGAVPSKLRGTPTDLCPSQSFPHAWVWKPLGPPPAPLAIPGQSRRAFRTGVERGPRHRRGDPCGQRLQARGLGAVPTPCLPAGCGAGVADAACVGQAPHPPFL